MIRKAKEEDIDSVEELYLLVHEYNRTHTNYSNWLGDIYPVRETAESAFERNDLFVYVEDGEVLGTEILNHHQEPEYEKIPWGIPAEGDEVLVIHTLCVSPKARGKGIAKALVRFAEQYGKDHGCKVMRFDTAETNRPAYSLYTSLGYAVPGKTLFVSHSGMLQMLYCFEKAL